MWTDLHRRTAERKGLRYPSDRSEAEWRLIEPLIPPAKRGGRKRSIYRTVPGQPNFIAEFSNWNFSVAPTDADFTFQPPEGAKQVELKAAAAPPAKAKGATR